jgi:hypothetical protein
VTDAEARPIETTRYHTHLRQSVKRIVQDELRRVGVIGTTLDGSHVGGLGYVNNYLLDNGQSPLTTEPRPYIRFRGLKSRLLRWSVLGQPPAQSTLRIDIGKTSFDQFEDLGLVPSIVGEDLPRLQSEWARESTDLSDWRTLTFDYGDVIRVSIGAVDGFTTFVTLSLELERIV